MFVLNVFFPPNVNIQGTRCLFMKKGEVTVDLLLYSHQLMSFVGTGHSSLKKE